MAFALNCSITGMEFRGLETGTSKKGNVYKSMRLEDGNGRTVDVSVTDSSLFADVDALKRGDIIDCDVVAVATYKGNSFVSLASVPVVTGNNYGGAF